MSLTSWRSSRLLRGRCRILVHSWACFEIFSYAREFSTCRAHFVTARTWAWYLVVLIFFPTPSSIFGPRKFERNVPRTRRRLCSFYSRIMIVVNFITTLAYLITALMASLTWSLTWSVNFLTSCFTSLGMSDLTVESPRMRPARTTSNSRRTE